MSDPDDVLAPSVPLRTGEELPAGPAVPSLDHLGGTDPERVRDDLAALADLVATGIDIDGRVVQVAESTWAIYGHALYEGEVIVGEYPDAGEASEVLDAAPRRDRPDEDEQRR